jgi:CobQ/CobB/MinD/ParA nucleotide binding domain
MTTWFDVITLATPKGGTGKSTLSRGLAAYWFALGRKPALVDADPTETLAKRYNPDGPLGAVPVIAEPEERVGEVIAELRRRHTPVIVDTAGFRNRTNITALVATDLALSPICRRPIPPSPRCGLQMLAPSLPASDVKPIPASPPLLPKRPKWGGSCEPPRPELLLGLRLAAVARPHEDETLGLIG